MADPEISDSDRLDRIARELTTMRQLVQTAISFMREAEAEIPEKIRRFMNYMHDVHDIKYMYEELGHPVPKHINEELERLDDRYRQILVTLHTDGGAFEKIRAEMASDPLNRWNHTRQLSVHRPKESSDETRPSNHEPNGLDQSGTEAQGG